MATLPLFNRKGGGVPGTLQRFSTCEVTILSKHVIVGEALIHQGVPLVLGHCFPFLLIQVSKADVFHSFLREFVIILPG
jgi:hypothetical protein